MQKIKNIIQSSIDTKQKILKNEELISTIEKGKLKTLTSFRITK